MAQNTKVTADDAPPPITRILADLHAKFHGLVDPVLGVARAGKLIEQCASVATLGELRGLTALARG